ncbi:FixH family protein [Myroides ceti]|uniref:FixH family protein n=1 Tax=Paenimyroides ceti TaxID=395087 RepID=A0ABT8CTN9_9FLAO|nr:FixH family protein [Paenimyroides ceti]MDN3707867.1 FixH family protein [Paenimyroides ceti]
MKFNWGTAIVICFILFMGFILQYVFKVQFNSRYDNELVTEDYYQQEIEVDGEFERETNGNILGSTFVISSNEEGIIVSFPQDFDYHKIKGNISLYRPSNQKLDQTLPLKLSSTHLLIPKNQLEDGRWDITIDWEYEGKGYLKKQSVNLM